MTLKKNSNNTTTLPAEKNDSEITKSLRGVTLSNQTFNMSDVKSPQIYFSPQDKSILSTLRML